MLDIEKIYESYLNESGGDSPEKMQADEDVDSILKLVIKDREMMIAAETIIDNAEGIAEEQGFKNGFNYALKLLMQC